MIAHAGPPRCRFRAALLATAGLVLGACAEPPPSPPQAEPAAVFVVPAALELRAGETLQLTAQSNDAEGQAIGGAELEFESEVPAVADVTREGLVSATGPTGATTIVVASGPAETRVPVVVRPGRAAALVADPPLPPESPAADALDLAVRATDAFGNGVSGVPVGFTVVDGGGAVEPPTAATDAGGFARVRWTLGEAAAKQSLVATAAGLPALPLHTVRPLPSVPDREDAAVPEEARATERTPTAGRRTRD